MESNIKGLVSAGHEMASELKAECGAVDMRSVAKLISDLATQLEVQLARANALAEDHQRAIESIKQADSAVKLAHEKFSALAAENAGIKSAIPESRDIEDDNDNMDDVSLAEDFGFNHAIERMRRQIPETPSTDAFLAEVRAQGVVMCSAEIQKQTWDEREGDGMVAAIDAMEIYAAQLRKGAQS